VNSIAASGIVFACVAGGTLLAIAVKRRLPEHHLNPDSKDVVKLGMGLIATLSALVLGLLIATAKGAYDAQSASVQDLAAQVRLIDRALGKYGKQETEKAREHLKEVVEATLADLWPAGGARPASLAPGEAARAAGDALYDQVAALTPANAGQAALKARALGALVELAQIRLRLVARQDSSLPLPFLVVLVLWLAVLFVGYGLLAPPNATVVTVLLVCALSLAGAVFLLLELSMPFTGIMRISSTPLRDALPLLGQ
jgi:hypothetical protein